MLRHISILAAFIFCAAPAAGSLPAPDADNGGILLPPGFRALVYADNLVVDRKVNGRANNLRFIAVAPNGDVYAKTKRGPLLALRDSNGDGRADIVKEFGEGGGTGLQFHDGWLYHSTDKNVYRWKYKAGELVPAGPPELIIADLPNQRTHESKSFFFDDQGRLIVETGVPSNAYGGENDRRLGAKGSDATAFLETYGGFWRFDPAKPGQKQSDGEQITRGHRHVVGVAWHPLARAAFFVMHGRDNLNTVAPQYYSEAESAELPGEEFHMLREGQDLGWPYTYWDPVRKARMISPEFGGDGKTRDENPRYQPPIFSFPAHWAPLQMAYYGGQQFPARYHNGLFIAFHGSWNRAPFSQRGYHVCFIPFDPEGRPLGNYEIFAHGFPGKAEFAAPRDATYRPGGVAVGPDGSLYISETEKGRIWRVIYTGESPAANRSAPLASSSSSAVSNVQREAKTAAGQDNPSSVNRAQLTTSTEAFPAGRALYLQFCATCHMADGSGVPNLQPALIDSTLIAGDPAQLAKVLLHGPAAVLPADRPKFANIMPPYATLFDDQQTADIVNYIRSTFANNPNPITVEQIGLARSL